MSVRWRRGLVAVLLSLSAVFARAEDVVSRYFADRQHRPEHGTIEIAGERYILVRAASLSVEFFSLVRELYGPGREPEAEGWLRRGLAVNPQSADLAHALGLSLVRQQRPGEATAAFAQAAGLAPDNPRYPYVYAVALQSDGRLAEAIGVLEDAYRRHPGDLDILSALATFHRDGGNRQAALRYARKLQALLPDNPAADRLVQELAVPE